MPGRQAHGRPLIAANGGGKGKNKRSKAKSNSRALGAYAAAQAEVGDQQKHTPRYRQLDADLDDGAPRGKHARDDDDDEDDDEDDERPRKMRRGARRGGEGEDKVEYGSDSSGNSWRVNAVGSDDDSEIDSDEAFGESDEERFAHFKFPGSKNKNKSKNKKKQPKEDDDDEDDEDEDIGDADGASLGSDAIDLADALDMSMSDDNDDEPDGDDEEGEDDSDAEDGNSSDESSDVESDDEGDEKEAGINAWVSQFAGAKNGKDDEVQTISKPKLGLKELGLLSVKDSELKKSLKLMTKDERATKKQKLEVPLARRAQAKLDREVAYEKTNESLGRWLETVKAMRRTDTSLVFPLPQHDTGAARLDNTELEPLNQKTAGTELENTIMAIMEESGLGISAEPKKKAVIVDEDGQTISRKAMLQQKRRERELQSREEARAKRIKKIKSKAYHRVHRRQRERDEMKEREIMAASGEIDSEEEREARDRQRAEERMGARHRESKWAKQANKNGRAAWDEDVRVGVTEMARRDEELRRRIEGKSTNKGSDDESDASDDSADSDVDERIKILRELKKLDAAEDSEPKSKLMNMEFMKKAEARRKQENDELIADMRRELASDAEDLSESDHGPEDVGRRTFGQSNDPKHGLKASKPNKKTKTDKADQAQEDISNPQQPTTSRSKVLSAPVPQDNDVNRTAGAWSQPTASGSSKKQRGKKTGPSTDVLEIDVNSVAISAQPQAPAKSKTKAQKKGNTTQDDYSSDDEEQHMPVQFREQELIERAFGGLDVFEAEFQAEKDAAVADDDEKMIETTLPGWGSWVGEGVKKRENQRRFFTKKEGVKPEARQDFKNNRAIINEKRVKKNDKYLASQLPHQYESRAQYERSLRLPIGPEFLTKQSFQDATKPRVIIKQGIIAPISKPTH